MAVVVCGNRGLDRGRGLAQAQARFAAAGGGGGGGGYDGGGGTIWRSAAPVMIALPSSFSPTLLCDSTAIMWAIF